VASINWGDGHVTVATVSGAGGSFALAGRHKYSKNGHYTMTVAVTMTGQASASASASGVVVVSNPPRNLAHARLLRRPNKKVKAARLPQA
jgi:hypothetical protein